jgi:uncharacterized membrane-anchored protein
LRTAWIGIGLSVLSVVLTLTISIGGILCLLYGFRMSFAAKQSQPALAWTGIALNTLAGILWIAVYILSKQAVTR